MGQYLAVKVSLGDALQNHIMTAKPAQRFLGWLSSSVEKVDKDKFIGGAPAAGFSTLVSRAFKMLTPRNVMLEKQLPAGATKELAGTFSTVFQLQGYSCKSNFCNMTCLVHGCSELRICCAGSESIGAIKVPDGESISYSKFVADHNAMDGETLKKCFAESLNFFLKLNVGDACFLPAGFLFFTLAAGGSTVIRKSVFPPFAQEASIVKKTCLAVIEGHPDLQASTWGAWLRFLEKE